MRVLWIKNVVSNNAIFILPPAAPCSYAPGIVFIKRNRTVLAGRDYGSILLVQGKRVPAKRPPGRPAAGGAAETLANPSKRPAELIEIIERHCKGQPPPPDKPAAAASGCAAAAAIHLGPCYGVLAGLDGLARELGLVQAVGEQSRSQRLALFLIYARLAHQGSRLSAARWSGG